MDNLRQVGGEGEEQAKQFLLQKGYTIMTQNFGVAKGEIDLIALSPQRELVFVEVKRLRGHTYGSAAAKVTPEKLKTIRRVAQYYMVTRKLEGQPCRIDVVTLENDEMHHFENCFTLGTWH